MYIAAGIGWCRLRRNCIVDRQSGDRTLTAAKRVALFVHYDRRGRVPDYVLHYLRCLRDAGFEIVFISNAPYLLAEARDTLKPLCALVLRRRNIGHDFGAYKDGISVLANVASLDELVLANDSVYGPFEDLASVISRCDPDRAAVWGITDSWFRRFHLQSYFVLFTRRALTHPAFARFWKNVRYVRSKRWIIEKYEIGLTQLLTRSGVRCAALYPYRRAAAALSAAAADLCKERRADDETPAAAISDAQQRFLRDVSEAIARGRPLNATHHFWDYLLADMKCPFLKRDLLTWNPAGIPALQRWEQLLQTSFDYDTDLILRHLETQTRNRAV